MKNSNSNSNVVETTEEVVVEEVTELTDEQVAEAFADVGVKLQGMVKGRFTEDLALGAELLPLMEQTGASTVRIGKVLDVAQNYIWRITTAAQIILDWDAALGRKNVDVHGLVAVYSKGRRQVSASGLVDFVNQINAYTAEPTAPLASKAVVAAAVTSASKAIDKAFAGLNARQRKLAVAALLEQLEGE